MTFDGNRTFLHGFEQSRLRFRRRTVDFVRQNDVGENRSFDEYAAAFSGGAIFFDDFGSGNVGRHQVGRELDALEIEVQDLRDGRDQQCLGQAGNAGDDRVTAGQHRNHDLIDDIFLADDDLANLVIDFL